MRAVGQYIIVKQDPEQIKKTAGGLELNEKTREDMRFRTGTVISVGDQAQVISEGEKVMFDKQAGFKTDITGDEYLVITLRDVVAVL